MVADAIPLTARRRQTAGLAGLGIDAVVRGSFCCSVVMSQPIRRSSGSRHRLFFESSWHD